MPRADTPPLDVALQGGRDYTVHFKSLGDVPALMAEANLRKGRCIIVTDENVAPLYLQQLEEALSESEWQPKSIVVPAGESTKSSDYLHRLYDDILSWRIDRKTPLLALGGGVVGDLSGFAAATLLRGVPLVQLPTTLIAQVDSAIGGKTGINHSTGKNLIGAFHQPAFVCVDTEAPQTLPQREWTSGLAEVVKHALIADASFFSFLESNWEAILERRRDVIPEMIHRAAAIKTEIVADDEREKGRRAILNFGHTFGHAIERTAGYGRFTHGEAIAVGMRAGLYLSHQLHPEVPLDRTAQLVRRLPVEDDPSSLDFSALVEAMQYDKKTEAGTVRYAVLRRLGEAHVTAEVAPEAVKAAWQFAVDLSPDVGTASRS